MVLALFFCGGGAEINKKKHKKIGKNNRGWGKIRHFVGVKKIKKEGKHMTYKTGDQVRDEANVPIHKLMFQKMKNICESARPGWIIIMVRKTAANLNMYCLNLHI